MLEEPGFWVGEVGDVLDGEEPHVRLSGVEGAFEDRARLALEEGGRGAEREGNVEHVDIIMRLVSWAASLPTSRKVSMTPNSIHRS